jgi:peptide/nickel transport system permease protein
MLSYIFRRVLWVAALLIVLTVITFVIFSVMPSGDPAAQRAGRQPSPELVESIRKSLGLDRSKPNQLCRYMWDVAPLFKPDKAEPCLGLPSFSTEGKLGIDFGYSFVNDEEILPEILSRVGPTAVLAGGAVVLWLLLAIPIGMVSAIKTGSFLDRLLMGLALVAISAPVYFFGLVSLYLFADDIGKFKILPGNGAYGQAEGIPEKMHAMILPWIVLATAFAAVYARFLRGNLIDVMQEDYIRTARAKGLSEGVVIFKHATRSALTPIVTLLGLDIGILLGGAILTETVFNIQGIGRFAFDAISRQDLPVIQGTVLFGAFFIVTMSLIVDIAYAFLDPRVRYS